LTANTEMKAKPIRDLEGRIALITGGSAGIGRAIAEELGLGGARILVHGLEIDEARRAAEDLREIGVEAIECAVDLLQDNAVATIRDRCLEVFGRLPEIVVLSASIEILQTIEDISTDAMNQQTRINLQSTVEIIKEFLPSMRARRWGRILAIGSIQELRPNPQHLYYAALKCAQTSLMLNLAKHEARPAGTDLTFNVIRPGAIETNRTRAVLSDPARRKTLDARIPVGHVGKPSDVAALARLICSSDGAYMNGGVFDVDGGLRL
jgi:NAD(P)-dependent dehydrogenase (short-subunit alcohol dehydrogenase family)